MLANCLLPSTVDVADNTEALYSNISTENDATRSNIETELADDDDVAQELRDDSSLRDEAEKGTPLPANNSILGDFSLFRDFFFAAFSDGCYKVRFKHVGRRTVVYICTKSAFLVFRTRCRVVERRAFFQEVAFHSGELENYQIQIHLEMVVIVERFNHYTLRISI